MSGDRLSSAKFRGGGLPLFLTRFGGNGTLKYIKKYIMIHGEIFYKGYILWITTKKNKTQSRTFRLPIL